MELEQTTLCIFSSDRLVKAGNFDAELDYVPAALEYMLK